MPQLAHRRPDRPPAGAAARPCGRCAIRNPAPCRRRADRARRRRQERDGRARDAAARRGRLARVPHTPAASTCGRSPRAWALALSNRATRARAGTGRLAAARRPRRPAAASARRAGRSPRTAWCSSSTTSSRTSRAAAARSSTPTWPRLAAPVSPISARAGRLLITCRYPVTRAWTTCSGMSRSGRSAPPRSQAGAAAAGARRLRTGRSCAGAAGDRRPSRGCSSSSMACCAAAGPAAAGDREAAGDGAEAGTRPGEPPAATSTTAIRRRRRSSARATCCSTSLLGPCRGSGRRRDPAAARCLQSAGRAGRPRPDARRRRGGRATLRRPTQAFAGSQHCHWFTGFPDGAAWVHRWTAEGLARLSDRRCPSRPLPAAPASIAVAGAAREPRSRRRIEAVRNFLAGGHVRRQPLRSPQRCLDAAAPLAAVRWHCRAGRRSARNPCRRTTAVTRSSPTRRPEPPGAGPDRTRARAYDAILQRCERLAAAEPDRADYQRDLSVSYNKMGDLYRALGQGEEARQASSSAGDLPSGWRRPSPTAPTTSATSPSPTTRWATSTARSARARRRGDAYLKSLAIASGWRRPSPTAPTTSATSRSRTTRWATSTAPSARARRRGTPILKSLAIGERLAAAEPDRADYQRDLSVSYEQMGDLYRALGQGEEARRRLPQVAGDRRAAGAGRARSRRLPARPLGLLQQDGRPLPRARPGRGGAGRLPEVAGDRRAAGRAEPDRADYQRDLSVSYERMGDLYGALGQGEEARDAYLSRWRSPSGWRRPSPTAPTTSATSRSPTTRWATSIAPSARARRRGRPT